MNYFNQVFGSAEGSGENVAGTNQLRLSRRRLVIGLICTCVSMMPSCRGSQAPLNSDIGSANPRKTTFTTPPFSTREPDRYQAIRITSFTETGSSGNPSPSQSNQVFIARDGEKRREEYFAGASGQIVYIEIPAGRFIVLPAGRQYADLASEDNETANPSNDFPDDLPNLSPDQLLNETYAPATYEKLGTETLLGRTANKYRIVVPGGAESQNETLIWVDEALGIPVRSETMSTSNGHSSKISMELKDVKLEVDERLFSWPSDYRKVEPRVILNLLRNESKRAIPK